MSEETRDSKRIVFEFRPEYAKWRIPLILTFIVPAGANLIHLLAKRGSIEALLASKNREDVIENEAAEEYGEDRLASATRAARQLDAASMRDAILRDVADFRGGAEVNDDLTLVVIKGTA
jgi:Stage II sporulation protein E (SpoIIE)